MCFEAYLFKTKIDYKIVLQRRTFKKQLSSYRDPSFVNKSHGRLA